MSFIVNKPYKVIWTSIPIVMILAIMGMNNKFDIQLNDTYVILRSKDIGIFFSIYLGIIGLIYWPFRKINLTGGMTLFHVVLTVFTAISLVLISLVFKHMDVERSTYKILNNCLLFLIVITIGSQLLFIFNLGIGIIKKIYGN